jgi:hypothetical protein
MNTVYLIAVMSSLNCGVDVLCFRAVEPRFEVLHPGRLHRFAKPLDGRGGGGVFF